ncbi:MAG: hypothetical protein ACI4NE_02535 [Succinivibrio sp.]
MKKLIFCLLMLMSLNSYTKEIVIKDKMFITTINDIYVNLEDYKNDTITFEGMYENGYFDDPEFEGRLFPFVYRLGPGCCFNDTYAGMYLEYDGELPPEGSWLKVSGHAKYFEHNGFTDLFLVVDKLEVMEKAGNLTVKD